MSQQEQSASTRCQTLATYVENAVIPRLLSRWAPAAIAPESHRIRSYILPILGEYQLAAITADHVNKFIDELHARGLNANTIAASVQSLRHIFNCAIQDYEVKVNPCRSIVARRDRPGPQDVITEEEFNSLLASLTCPQQKCLLVLVAFCQLRASDCSWLRWSDYDGRSLTIRKSKIGRVRCVLLLREALHVIEQYRLALNPSHSDELMFNVHMTIRRKHPTRFLPVATMQRIQAAAGSMGIKKCKVTFFSLARFGWGHVVEAYRNERRSAVLVDCLSGFNGHSDGSGVRTHN